MRTSRLIAVLMELVRLRSTTVARLADRHGVSERTIQRDLASLQEIGVPLWTRTGPAGGVGIVEGWRSPLTGMTGVEVQALLIGEAGAGELGLAAEFEAARAKMLAASPAARPSGGGRAGAGDDDGAAARAAERVHIDHGRWFTDPERPSALPEVSRAVWQDRRLSVRYERPGRPPVRRLLDPLGLVLKTDRWYLIAAHQAAVRTYRLSRIVDAVVVDEPVRRPEGFSLVEHWRAARAEFEASIFRLPVRLAIPESSVPVLRTVLPGVDVDGALE
ncbi:YafY family protein, partial [Nesterenkonia sp. F]|uniref:helix-turn-helix transcriptional regulator n=1 Tax=Nesterenkonia sp. F TaxID=795955 RepID=UPI000255CD09